MSEQGGREGGYRGRGGAGQGRGTGAGRRGGGPRDGRGFGGNRREGSGGGRRGGYGNRSAQRPSERARTGDQARLAAYTVLRDVAGGAYANLQMPRELRKRRLHGRDAAFATELAFGTIRERGFYDAVIAVAADRPVSRLDANVLDTLRLGAHQLLGMRVPEHAACDETVALARQVNGAGAASLVNAVLRRIAEHTADEWRERVTAGLSGVDRLEVEHSHPGWVIRALRAALIASGTPKEAADDEVERLLACDNTPAKVSLVARPGLADVEELLAEGLEPGHVSPVGAVLPQGDPGAIPAVRDHRAGVQDEGSQVLALALAAVPVEGRDSEWLDLCAGPGGKAALLAALARGKDAHLLANEVVEHRAELVRDALAPVVAAGGDVEVRHGDGRDIGEAAPEHFDRVLVDAPCTGLGALRRRPEARWRRTPTDLAALGPLQRELLRSAIEATRPGGVVAYATCSPHLAETSLVVQDVLKGREDVEPIDAREALRTVGTGVLADGDLVGLGPGPWAQLWPHRHGTDGMFLALLRKR